MNPNLTKWKVKFGTNLQFTRYFCSKENAISFAVETNGAIYAPLYGEI